MGSLARRLGNGGAIPLGCALTALWPAPANAQSGAQIFTRDAFEISGDVRLVAVDGEKGWVDGGFGKLRSGNDGDFRIQPQLGNVSLVWKPQFTWSLGAVPFNVSRFPSLKFMVSRVKVSGINLAVTFQQFNAANFNSWRSLSTW